MATPNQNQPQQKEQTANPALRQDNSKNPAEESLQQRTARAQQAQEQNEEQFEDSEDQSPSDQEPSSLQ